MIQQHPRLARSVPLVVALALSACGGTNDSATTAADAASTSPANAAVATKDNNGQAWLTSWDSNSNWNNTWDSNSNTTTAADTWNITTQAVSDYVPAGYSIVFSDNFDGSSLDRSRWCTRFAYGSGPTPQVLDTECTYNGLGTMDFLNDEQQRYVDTNTAGAPMHVVSDGNLKLMATRTRPDSWVSYESAMIRAKYEFRADAQTSYYVTARVNMPSVKGTWPAFWLVPTVEAGGRSAWPPEIDMLEAGLNGVEDTVNMFHMGSKQQNWGGWGPNGAPPVTYTASNFEPVWGNFLGANSMRDKWVEIGLEWTDSSTCFFVDGVKVLCESYRWVDNNGAQAPAAQLLLNLAIGGGWAGRHGIESEKFPTSLGVDHVRVYEKKRW